MAGRKKPIFQCIENDRPIESGTDSKFIQTLQYALLAALHEKGMIDYSEYLNAEDLLKQKGMVCGLNS